jgi:hypothetical protein
VVSQAANPRADRRSLGAGLADQCGSGSPVINGITGGGAVQVSSSGGDPS